MFVVMRDFFHPTTRGPWRPHRATPLGLGVDGAGADDVVSDVAQFAVGALADGAKDVERGVVGDLAGAHEDADRGADASAGHERGFEVRDLRLIEDAVGVEMSDDLEVDVAVPFQLRDRLLVGDVLTFQLLDALPRLDLAVVVAVHVLMVPTTCAHTTEPSGSRGSRL